MSATSHAGPAPTGSAEPPLVAVKDILSALYLYPLRFSAGVLPLSGARALGRLIEPLYQLLARKAKRVAEQPVALATGRSPSDPDVRRVVRRFIGNAVRRSFDDFVTNRVIDGGGPPHAEVQGVEYLNAALAAGKGVLLTTGHFYANRMGKRYLDSIGYPIMSVRHDEPSDPMMGRLGRSLLQARYVEFLHDVIRDAVYARSPDCSTRMFQRLRTGGIVNVQVDVAFSREWIRLPFLGQEKRMAAGAMSIVRLSGCAVVPMLCLGDSRKLSVRFEPQVEMAPIPDRSEFAARNLPRVVERLERQVLENPEQWELWAPL